MDIKAEVRRRITDLTRFAYERGYNEGAQSTLTEIESMAAEDVVAQLGKSPAPLKAIAKTKTVAKRPAKAKRVNATKVKSKAKTRMRTTGRTAPSRKV